MHTKSSSIKQEFLKKWIMGIQISRSLNKNMSILEKKNAIKLSADIAMASTKNGTTCWSQALLSNASKNGNKFLVDQILGRHDLLHLKTITNSCSKKFRSKRILKKSCSIGRRIKKRSPPQMVAAKSIATKLVKKRTKVLKNLVPGGEFMDEICLIEEALDYIVSLKAQVDVMQCVVNAAELNRNL